MPIRLTITLRPIKGQKAKDHVPVLRAQLLALLPERLAVHTPPAVYGVRLEVPDQEL